jgi:hypothetical protein
LIVNDFYHTIAITFDTGRARLIGEERL